MQPAETIAQIVGPLYAVIGVGLMVNAEAWPKMIREYAENTALCFLGGFLTLILGLLILAFHHAWTADWRVVVTVFGWLAAIKGGLLLIWPKPLLELSERLMTGASQLRYMGAASVALGLFFVVMGYGLV